jgi:hypothetical protein
MRKVFLLLFQLKEEKHGPNEKKMSLQNGYKEIPVPIGIGIGTYAMIRTMI